MNNDSTMWQLRHPWRSHKEHKRRCFSGKKGNGLRRVIDARRAILIQNGWYAATIDYSVVDR